MHGYLGNAEATASTLDSDGWLHTGDVATVTSDGLYRIVDRLKELIKYKGYQVAPAVLGRYCSRTRRSRMPRSWASTTRTARRSPRPSW